MSRDRDVSRPYWECVHIVNRRAERIDEEDDQDETDNFGDDAGDAHLPGRDSSRGVNEGGDVGRNRCHEGETGAQRH